MSDSPYRRIRTFRPKALGDADKNAHPLVRALFAEMHKQQVTMIEMAERSGVSRETLESWRSKRVPDLVNLEACLNVLGLHLTASPTLASLALDRERLREALRKAAELANDALAYELRVEE